MSVLQEGSQLTQMKSQWLGDVYSSVAGELQTLTNWLVEDVWRGQVLPVLPEIGTWVLGQIANTGEHQLKSVPVEGNACLVVLAIGRVTG